MEKSILLFTTDALPYAFHNINILSFPQGLSYRFRYLKKYVSKSALDLAMGQEKGKNQLNGFVIFQFKDGLYFPYRKIELIKAYDYGNLVFFNTVLKEIVSIDSNSLTIVTENIRKLINNSEEPPKKLVFMTDEPKNGFNLIDESKEETNKVWSNSVDILSKAENLKNLSFLKFNLLKGMKEREKVYPSALTGDLRGYKLLPGKDYLVEFFEYCSIPSQEKNESAKMFTISLKNDPNRIEVIKPEEIVDGKYDRFDLIFSTLSDASKDTAFLRIENTQSKEDKRIPDIYIPFCISLGPVWKIVKPMLLFASIFAFIDPKLIVWIIKNIGYLIPQPAKSISKISAHMDKEKWIQLVAILSFALSFWNFKFRSILNFLKEKIFR